MSALPQTVNVPNEADTCRRYIVPKLQVAGWEDEPHRINEQVTFTDGRIVVAGWRSRRRPGKRADYILRYRPDLAIAVVEAKPDYATPADGLQQAKQYAEILGLKFGYATNGHGIVEFDYTTGLECERTTFPTPLELWTRLTANEALTPAVTERLLAPGYHHPGMTPHYYQEIAINRAVQAIAQGNARALLTMATGTGKTLVAFQICWKLWSSRWNRTGEHRRPRILYLADRNILVDDPMARTFAPFADARWKIEHGVAVKSREMYFATYQSIARDERRPGLYREYAPDFFDLIIVDECHRGSARDDSNWREILNYFEPAFQIGMTAMEIGDKDRVDVILTNPPFGGEEERGILNNFPEDKQTIETALLFLQVIMRELRRSGHGSDKGGRAGIVVPNGTLFGDGICARIKDDLLKEFNLHTIVRLPNGVFAPYTSIPTNLLFFDRSGPTKDVWYYEQPLPEGRKQYTKTQPLQVEEFESCLKWWKKREVNDRAWKVAAKDILANGCNLDLKNPSAKQDFEHLPPDQLAEDILQKELRIAEIMREIKELLKGRVS